MAETKIIQKSVPEDTLQKASAMELADERMKKHSNKAIYLLTSEDISKPKGVRHILYFDGSNREDQILISLMKGFEVSQTKLKSINNYSKALEYVDSEESVTKNIRIPWTKVISIENIK